jgi:hypothetical protein
MIVLLGVDYEHIMYIHRLMRIGITIYLVFDLYQERSNIEDLFLI